MADRRQDVDVEFEGSDQRSGEDRRQGDRRTLAADKHGKGYYAAWGFAAGVLPAIGLLLLIQVDNPSGWKRGTPKGAVNMDIEDPREFQPPRNPGIGMEVPKEPKKSDAGVLTEDLLNIAPDLYNGVKLKSRKSGGETVIGADGLANVELVDVESIEIAVKAKTWDRLLADERITTLKRTWDFLTTRYPSLAQIVELSFDDGRPNLQIRF